MIGFEIYDENGNKTFDENSCKTRVEGVIEIEYDVNGTKRIPLNKNQKIWAFPQLNNGERDIRVVVDGSVISWVWDKPHDYVTIREESSYYSNNANNWHSELILSNANKRGNKIIYGTYG